MTKTTLSTYPWAQRFNELFTRDVDSAYEYLKDQLHTHRHGQGLVPVTLANGQKVMVSVGEAS